MRWCEMTVCILMLSGHAAWARTDRTGFADFDATGQHRSDYGDPITHAHRNRAFDDPDVGGRRHHAHEGAESHDHFHRKPVATPTYVDKSIRRLSSRRSSRCNPGQPRRDFGTLATIHRGIIPMSAPA